MVLTGTCPGVSRNTNCKRKGSQPSLIGIYFSRQASTSDARRQRCELPATVQYTSNLQCHGSTHPLVETDQRHHPLLRGKSIADALPGACTVHRVAPGEHHVTHSDSRYEKQALGTGCQTGAQLIRQDWNRGYPTDSPPSASFELPPKSPPHACLLGQAVQLCLLYAS